VDCNSSSGHLHYLEGVEMSLFEDWYLTYFQDFIDLEEDLIKNEDGEYLDVRVDLMHKAFLAGQVLCEEFK
jgi:hypothetical protein